MASLPVVGDTSNTWGTVLNGFLAVSLNSDGTLLSPAVVAKVEGGTAVGSSLALQSTSAVGTTDFINFLVGNNGATEALRILHAGTVQFSQIATAGFATFNASGQVSSSAAWSAFTPTVTASSGTFTTVSGAGRFLQIGKTMFFTVKITITTVGTASGFVVCTLPNGTTSQSDTVLAGGITNTANMVAAYIGASSTTMSITKFDASGAISAGNVIEVAGVYETT